MKNLIKSIPSIVENKDNYTWVQLNCFLKAMAIIFESFQKGYFDIFLLYSSFFLIYNPDNCISNYKNDFISFFNDYLSPSFGVYINKIKCSTKDEAREEIVSNIDSDFPVLVPTDLFGLYYDSQYLREHHRHFVIVKGYDLSRNLFFILDNMHVDRGASTIYKDFVIKIDDLIELNQLFSIYENDIKEYAFWSFQPIKSESKIRSINDALTYICNYYKEINNSKVGVTYHESEITEMENDKIKYKIALTNLKDVYFDILIKFFSISGLKENILKELNKDIFALKNNWKKVSINSVYYKYKNLNTAKSRDSLEELIQNNVNEERKLRAKLINAYNHICKCEVSLFRKKTVRFSNTDFTVENTNNAIININENSVEFVLSDNKTFDTWVQHDSCPKILTEVPSDMYFSLEAQISADAPLRSPYHTGFIVKLSNGSMLLFGNHRGFEISLFHPQNNSDFIIESLNINDEKIWLRLDISKTVLHFYYKKNKDRNWLHFKTFMANDKVSYCGLFAKSWERMAGRFTFSCIKCDKTDMNDNTISDGGNNV